MGKIQIKGPIVLDADAWIYDWLGMPCACPKKLQKALEEAGGKDVELEINSPGGYVSSGFEMYQTVRDYAGKVSAHVITACSAATLLVCAADEALISEVGYIMIHNASRQTSGSMNKSEMRQSADQLQQIDDGILNAYVKKTGISKDELQALMDAESYMGAEKAIAYGFIDGYIEGDKGAAVQAVASETPMISAEKMKELANLIEHRSERTKDTAKEEGGEKKMTLQEFLQKNPEAKAEQDAVIAEATQSGADAERERIQSLDAIAKTVPEKALNEAKYGKNKVDGKTLAYDAMVKGELKAEAYIKDAAKDSAESGAEGVGTGKGEAGEPENTDAEDMAAFVNSRKGV